MKQTVEEAAVDFADYELKNLDKLPFVVSAKADYDNGLTKGFKFGAEWQSKQSPWINVRDDLPKDYELKLILLRNGQVRSAFLDSADKNDFKIEYYWYDREADKTFDFEDVIAWMPIPSFDDILEANRDVLERIKEKGD